MSEGELILYTTDDGAATVSLQAVGGNVWLNLREIAELLGKDVRTVSEHIQNIFAEGECDPGATVRKFRIVQTEGKRQVGREVDAYNLDVILAVGYRVRSARGTQFRRWATTTLREYLVKGFVMNDERLKDPAQDYFDELLERIRDIRASEARFYQKVRDILALSADYERNDRAVVEFYARIQNKMLHAVTGHTAAEVIAERANPDRPHMGLTSWKGSRVRKGDVTTAKNYLGKDEISQLNLIVTMFLDTADLRARRREAMYLGQWEDVLDAFLQSNELPVLRDAGGLSAAEAKQITHQHYADFDAKRKEAERITAAQTDEIAELERIADASNPRRKGGGDG